VKRDAIVDDGGAYEDNKMLMNRFSFLRAHTQSALPTHVEAQVHVQVDSDAELHVLGMGRGSAPGSVRDVSRAVSLEDMRRRETVTSTTLTMLSQMNANVNMNTNTNAHAPVNPPSALSPTSTMLNTHFSSLHEKSAGGAPSSPMVMSPMSAQSAMTYVGSMDEKAAKGGKSSRGGGGGGFFAALASFLPFLRLRSDANKPSGCNDFHTYAYADHAHHYKSRKSRKTTISAAAAKRDSSPSASDDTASVESWQPRLAIARHVPAFGPVTRVLNPVVTRAQWEIVVRAAMLAFVMTLAIVGALCAAPVPPVPMPVRG
jgi:hypothetical protein